MPCSGCPALHGVNPNLKKKKNLEFILKKNFLSIIFNGKTYKLPCKVTVNAYLRSFQYKILNNILYLNKKLYTFGLSNTQLCSFCKIKEETLSHLFYFCTHIQEIWNQVQTYFTDCFHFSQLTPKTAIFGFFNIDNDTFLIQNHILLLFRLHI